jgi:hypothetical protein
MPPSNEFSRYVGLASLAFEVEEFRVDSFPHLWGIAPEICEEILRYLLEIDRCRAMSPKIKTGLTVVSRQDLRQTKY